MNEECSQIRSNYMKFAFQRNYFLICISTLKSDLFSVSAVLCSSLVRFALIFDSSHSWTKVFFFPSVSLEISNGDGGTDFQAQLKKKKIAPLLNLVQQTNVLSRMILLHLVHFSKKFLKFGNKIFCHNRIFEIFSSEYYLWKKNQK